MRHVASALDKQFAEFLRKERGDATYAKFARKLGVSPGMLHRLMHEQQSATLRALSQILKRLKRRPRDVFFD
jgi:transcriptional regulator with XRE-family HTH domain